MSKNKMLSIPLEKIEQIENVRARYRAVDMSELMTSMKQTGLLQPVGVKELGRGMYRLIFGNRRFLAAKKLGWTTIDATIIESENEEDDLINNVIENMQRANVSMAEQGRIFQMLEKRELTASEIAARIGVPKSRVTISLQLFNKMPEKYRAKLSKEGGQGRREYHKKGSIPAATAFAVLNTSNRQKLDEKDTDALFKYGTQDGVTSEKIHLVGKLINSGMSFDDALTKSESIRVVAVTIAIDIERAAELEQQEGMGIHSILEQKLMNDKTLGLLGRTRYRRQKTETAKYTKGKTWRGRKPFIQSENVEET